MILPVWQAKCDEDGCEESVVFDAQPTGPMIEAERRPGWVRLMDATGWVHSLDGRTANMTFCPDHAGADTRHPCGCSYAVHYAKPCPFDEEVSA